MMLETYGDLVGAIEFKSLRNYLVEKAYNSSNIFDILNAGNYEIRHSKYLAWLFENSNLCELLFDFKPDENGVNTEYPAEINNKKGQIDILIESKNSVCVIENKYGSIEHSKQCQRYRKFVETKFRDKDKKYIFLDIYEPDKELFEEGKSLEGYVSKTYEDILNLLDDKKFSLDNKADNDFNRKVLEQYKEILNRNYNFSSDDIKHCSEVLNLDGAIKILLEKYKYVESKADDCMTIYKLQSYMWATCLKKGNELIEKIYRKLSENYLEILNEKDYKYTSNSYGVYRCVPKDCDGIEKLNFGNDIYNPIMHIAISNNLNILGGKNKGINISLELAEGDEEKRTKLYKAINKVLKTNYSTKIWKTLKQVSIIERKEFFKDILNEKKSIEDLLEEKSDEINKINDLVEEYKDILDKYKGYLYMNINCGAV